MKKIIACFLFVIVLLSCTLPIASQGSFSGEPAKLITQFKFQQFSGGVVIIQARVNHYPDTLNFILDTGSGGISLDSATVSALSIPTQPSERTIRGIAGIRKVNFLYNATLHLPGLSLDSLNFHVNDYEILSSVYGFKIDGIIGYSFFSRFIVHLDYDNLLLSVYSQGDFKYQRGGYILKPLLTSIPIMHADFRDDRRFNSRFYFDSGAGLCFLLSDSFSRDSAVLNPNKTPVLTQAEGLGGKMEMRLTTVKEVRIGPYRFRNVPTYIFEDIYNITAYPYLAGLVGNDLLRRFNVTLNYARREIHLIPNSHYRSPFDYAYTGLGIYVVEGKIQVEDVITGSPGEEAGFKTGDILVSVGNNLSNNIQAYKNLLQVPGQKIKIIVNRSDSLVVLTLKPASIL
ncbi:aspartyl protease family protein [Agriterribacter sp.]|uniref:aspartyl protease family protein n=1 Tax=Agriterribacter sp. TaxID=2821509 RepID=UPI002CDECA52|nr:aspartyl protease family protein [Agriterribacter sp.]HTN07800.1 aspartyl protease family protein [Agriterribacter sp.]